MSGRNTVQVNGTSPESEIQFVLFGANFTKEQVEAIEVILKTAEQQIFRCLSKESASAYQGNEVTEDRTWGHGP